MRWPRAYKGVQGSYDLDGIVWRDHPDRDQFPLPLSSEVDSVRRPRSFWPVEPILLRTFHGAPWKVLVVGGAFESAVTISCTAAGVDWCWTDFGVGVVPAGGVECGAVVAACWSGSRRVTAWGAHV